MEIRNITDQPVEIDVPGQVLTVAPGETVDVPDEIAAGLPPEGAEDDPNYFPGTTGLVGTGKFEQVSKRKSKDASASDESPSGEEG